MPDHEGTTSSDLHDAGPRHGRPRTREVDLVQLLTPEGERVAPPRLRPRPQPTTSTAALYRDLALTRRVDLEATALQRQGELGPVGRLPRPGGRAGRLGPRDGAGRLRLPDLPRARRRLVTRGVDPLYLLGLFRGVSNGGWDPYEHNFALYTIVIGNQCLHAVGYAMGVQRDGRRRRAPTRRRLLRRRRLEPGRRQRVLHLGERLQRPGRVLLPEQPVGDLRAAREADPHPALPARRTASASPACGSTATTCSPSSP